MSNPVGEVVKAPAEAIRFTRKHLATAVFVGLLVVILYKLANYATQGRLGLALSRVPLLGRLFMSWPLVVGVGLALAAAACRLGGLA